MKPEIVLVEARQIGRTFKRQLSIEEEALVEEMRASSSFDVEAALARLWPTVPKWENPPQPEPTRHPLDLVINRHCGG